MVTNGLNSTDYGLVAFASLRMVPQYMIMGEAAGQAAAMTAAAATRARVQDVSVAQLQAALKARGGVLQKPATTPVSSSRVGG